MEPSALPLPASRLREAAAVLTRAFMDDPLYVHLLPSREERARRLPLLWRGLVRYSLRYGMVDAAPGMAGVACWLRPGCEDVTAGRVLRTGLAFPGALLRLPATARRALLEMARELDRLRREILGGPAWYLWALGVEPPLQGRGIGGALLARGLARADRDGLPCYLETMNERDLGFYERYGFEVVHAGSLPRSGVPFWALVRPPGA